MEIKPNVSYFVLVILFVIFYKFIKFSTYWILVVFCLFNQINYQRIALKFQLLIKMYFSWLNAFISLINPQRRVLSQIHILTPNNTRRSSGYDEGLYPVAFGLFEYLHDMLWLHLIGTVALSVTPPAPQPRTQPPTILPWDDIWINDAILNPWQCTIDLAMDDGSRHGWMLDLVVVEDKSGSVLLLIIFDGIFFGYISYKTYW